MMHDDGSPPQRHELSKVSNFSIGLELQADKAPADQGHTITNCKILILLICHQSMLPLAAPTWVMYSQKA